MVNHCFQSNWHEVWGQPKISISFQLPLSGSSSKNQQNQQISKPQWPLDNPRHPGNHHQQHQISISFQSPPPGSSTKSASASSSHHQAAAPHQPASSKASSQPAVNSTTMPHPHHGSQVCCCLDIL